MKHFLILLILTFFSNYFLSQTPNWQWAKTAQAPSSGNAVTTDNAGNMYITGVYVTNFTLGTFTLTNQLFTGGMSFLAKIDAAGNVIWCKNVSIYGGRSVSIAVDLNNNVFVLGDNLGGAGGPFFNNGTDVVSLFKFDSNGNELWSKCMGGNYYSNSSFVSTDPQGNALICGTFKGSFMAFNTTTITNTQPNITAFIAKYDGTGNVLWAKNITGNPSPNPNNTISAPTCITTDNSGNIYLTGWFTYSTLVCGSITLNNNSNSCDVFITKLNAAGNFIWAKNSSGSGDDYARNIGIDNQNNLYISGDFISPALSFGSFTLTNTNSNWFSEDLFIVKYDNNGNVLWAKSKDGSRLSAMGTDASGNTFVSGSLRDSLLFGTDKIKNTNFYLAKYDNNGNDIWGKGIKLILSTSGFANSNAINQKVNNDVYVTGNYNVKKMILDLDTLINPDQTGSMQTFFLGKISSNYVGLNEFSNVTSLHIFPNPNNGSFIIDNENNSLNLKTIRLKNILGQERPVSFSEINNKITIELLIKDPGVYFVEIENSNSSLIKKIIVN